MPRLSIVIPCLGGAAEFDGTLVSVLQHRPADCEVLVVHTASYDDPYRLRGEVRFVHVDGRSLVELLNAAVELASGDILHIIGCGLEAVEGWTEAALRHFGDPEVAAVTPLVLAADRQTLAAAGIRWSLGGARKVVADQRLLLQGSGRLRARILGPTLQAAFYRRDVLAALGGFDAAVGDAFADADLALAIRALGRMHVCEPAAQLILTTPDNAAAAAGGFLAGRWAQRVFWRHAASHGLAASLAAHPFTLAADVARQWPHVSTVTSLLGRAAATLEIGCVRRHEQRLVLAQQRLAELHERKETVPLPAEKPRRAAAPRRRAA